MKPEFGTEAWFLSVCDGLRCDMFVEDGYAIIEQEDIQHHLREAVAEALEYAEEHWDAGNPGYGGWLIKKAEEIRRD